MPALTDIKHGPSWALGCEKCTHGLISSVPLTGRDSIYMERMVQAIDGMVEFCDCQAGHMYRQFLRRQYKTVSALTARVGSGEQGVGEMLINQTRRHIEESAAKYVPTMRYEPSAGK